MWIVRVLQIDLIPEELCLFISMIFAFSSSFTTSSSSLHICVPPLLDPLLCTSYHPFSHLTQFCYFSYLPTISYPYHITLLLLILSAQLPYIPCQHVTYHALFSPSLHTVSILLVLCDRWCVSSSMTTGLTSSYWTPGTPHMHRHIHTHTHTHTNIHTNSFQCYVSLYCIVPYLTCIFHLIILLITISHRILYYTSNTFNTFLLSGGQNSLTTAQTLTTEIVPEAAELIRNRAK